MSVAIAKTNLKLFQDDPQTGRIFTQPLSCVKARL